MQKDYIPPRYELKYLISESQAELVRASIAPFCALDRFSAQNPDRQYFIDSLYLDSPHLDFHRAKKERAYRRLKMRVRTYGEQADGPVFLEIKRKEGEVVLKARSRVANKQWSQRAQALPSNTANDGDTEPETAAAERDFQMLLHRHNARPTLLVRYQREAYVSQVDSYARVTMDRRLQYQPIASWSLLGNTRQWSAADDVTAMHGLNQGLVLELKAEVAVPSWMLSLVRRLRVPRSGFSKYCTGVERLWGSPEIIDFSDRTSRWS